MIGLEYSILITVLRASWIPNLLSSCYHIGKFFRKIYCDHLRSRQGTENL